MDTELNAYLDAQFESQRQELRAGLERVDANLLKAFDNWARTMEVRQRGASASIAGLDERLNEVRISALERRTIRLQ